jgi:membrane-bound lytic murein transglycosylase F
MGVGCGPRFSPGDLPEIVECGTLRVIVRPGFGQWPTARGLNGVNQEELLQNLAARLGVALEWVRTDRHDQIVPWLLEGRGDIALGRFAPQNLESIEGVMATAKVDWVVDEVVSTQDGPIATMEDLGEARVALPASLQRRFAGWADRGLSRVEPVPEEMPWEQIVERVATGRFGVTVADSALVESVRRSGSDLRVVGWLAQRRSLVWAVRRSSPQLLRAIDDFLFASEVLDRSQAEPECRDLREIQNLRVLRLVTRNSPVTVTVERGGLKGFEYDLVSAFARSLGVRLELALPPPGVEPLEWLEAGYGDVAALHEPAPLKGAGGVWESVPYRHVDLVAVVASRTVPLSSVEELAGLPVIASTSVSSWCEEIPIEPPMAVEAVRPGGDALSSLVAVSRGEAYAAIVDADTARLELAERPGLVGGVTVLPRAPLVWVISPGAVDLMRRVDRFLRRSRKNGLIRQFERNHFGGRRAFVPARMPTIPPGALSPYDEVLGWAGRTHGIDWRLLASVMYEESRFDPEAVGPGGSAGLFQFMPFTWKELGVDDPHHPREAAEAGARYLRRLMDMLPEMETADRVAMAIASYNVGPGHIFDARRLAVKMGLDPNRWAGNVETALLILDDPEVAREYPSGVCRCRRAVGYTRRILRRYGAYRVQFPPS